MRAFRTALLVLALGAPLPVAAQPPGAPPLQQSVEARLREAGPGIRFGLVVATGDGRELVAVSPDARFIPASHSSRMSSTTSHLRKSS